MGVCNAAKAPVYERWKEAELQLSDAAGESRETVKYLATLEGSLECLYTSELGGGGEGVSGGLEAGNGWAWLCAWVRSTSWRWHGLAEVMRP